MGCSFTDSGVFSLHGAQCFDKVCTKINSHQRITPTRISAGWCVKVFPIINRLIVKAFSTHNALCRMCPFAMNASNALRGTIAWPDINHKPSRRQKAAYNRDTECKIGLINICTAFHHYRWAHNVEIIERNYLYAINTEPNLAFVGNWNWQHSTLVGKFIFKTTRWVAQ